MAKRGRKKGGVTVIKDACDTCEGHKTHWGKECPACDGTGSELVRKQLQKVYNAKHGKPINYNLKP